MLERKRARTERISHKGSKRRERAYRLAESSFDLHAGELCASGFVKQDAQRLEMAPLAIYLPWS